MAIPNAENFQITYRDFSSTEALDARIRENAAKLFQVFPKITMCRVAVEAPHQRHRHGPKFRCRVDLIVPSAELIGENADGDPIREDAYAAIEDAFACAARELDDYMRRARWEVKRHDGTPHARVAKLMAGDAPGEGYGFLETHDGREIYFHEHSVLNGHFHKLEIGTEVRFAEEDGDKGPQASTVAITKRRSRETTTTADADQIPESRA